MKIIQIFTDKKMYIQYIYSRLLKLVGQKYQNENAISVIFKQMNDYTSKDVVAANFLKCKNITIT